MGPSSPTAGATAPSRALEVPAAQSRDAFAQAKEDRRHLLAAKCIRDLSGQSAYNRDTPKEEHRARIGPHIFYGAEAYRINVARERQLRREINDAMPILLRRAVRKRTARIGRAAVQRIELRPAAPRRTATSSGRPRTRRTSSSSTTSSSDPGEGGSEPGPRPATANGTEVAS